MYLNILETTPRNNVSMTSPCHSILMMSFCNNHLKEATGKKTPKSVVMNNRIGDR